MLSGFGLVLLVGYCFLEFVLGYVLTVALRWFFHGQEMDFFDWKFQYLLVRPGFSEVRIEIGKFEWRNPAKFSKFKNFVELKRVEARIDPRPLWKYIQSKVLKHEKVRLVHVISSVEVEGVTVNLERKNGELSLWAALGLPEEVAVSKYDEVPYDETPSFDEEGDDFSVDKKEPLVVPEPRPDESVPIPKHWSKFMGEFIVDRVVVRHVRARPEAFLVKSRDTKRDETPVVRQRYIELSKRQLRPDYATKKKLKKRQGLYLDEVIWRAIKVVTKQVWADKNVRAIAGNVTKDALGSAVRSVNTSFQSKVLNATHSAPKLRVGTTKDENNYYPDQFALRVHVIQAKYLPTPADKKPSTYVKLAIGKKLVKAKSKVIPNSKNPQFDFSVDLAPVQVSEPLKIQLFSHGLFSKDVRLFPTLKVPIDHLFSAPAGTQEDLWLSFPAPSPSGDTLDDDDEDNDVDYIQPSSSPSTEKTPCIHITLSAIASATTKK